jgi:protoheme IX farnesyltransferase
MEPFVETVRRDAALQAVLADRVELTKPGITIFLVLVACVGYLLSAPAGTLVADPLRLIALIVAVGATVGGAATMNHVREAALDARMRRTRDRPIPSGRVARGEAVAIAVALTVTGLGLSLLFLPWTTALVLALGHAGYVLLYTPLKRVTPLCTAVGAFPGALPALAGCAAAGPLSADAWAFYGAVLLWQIPHFLSIGWLAREDYERAGFRVLPAEGDARRTGAWCVVSALLLLPVSVVPFLGGGIPAVNGAGAAVVVGAALALLLGLQYLRRSLALMRHGTDAAARRLFKLSIAWIPVYLVLLLTTALPGQL